MQDMQNEKEENQGDFNSGDDGYQKYRGKVRVRRKQIVEENFDMRFKILNAKLVGNCVERIFGGKGSKFEFVLWFLY